MDGEFYKKLGSLAVEGKVSPILVKVNLLRSVSAIPFYQVDVYASVDASLG